MVQFYFLSIAMNALAGCLLFFGGSSVLPEFKGGFSLKDETVRFVIGMLCAATGLFKLLSPVEGDVPLIGDLVPAVIGLLCGCALVFEHYRKKPADGEFDEDLSGSHSAKKVGKTLTANRKALGAAALVVAVLHFLFPSVLLL